MQLIDLSKTSYKNLMATYLQTGKHQTTTANLIHMYWKRKKQQLWAFLNKEFDDAVNKDN